MPAKLVMLYPHPTDPERFEADYHGRHMPLMRQLVGPDRPLPTGRVQQGRTPAPFYRMAEVPFASEAELLEFVRSDAARRGHASSTAVSTGGPPLALLVVEDERD
jgi:uncharacterized protein (TIGR02118 family)